MIYNKGLNNADWVASKSIIYPFLCCIQETMSKKIDFRYFMAVALWLVLPSAVSAVEKVDFNRDIRPLLSDRCAKCHGPDGGAFGEKWKGGLRLDTEEGARADLSAVVRRVKNAKRKAQGKEALTEKKEARFAFVPYRPEASRLVKRIFSSDENFMMPPPDSKLSLSSEEKNVLRQWVAEGAKWKKHWSFEVPFKSKLPFVKQSDWPQNEIDYFVLARLEKQLMAPSPEADRTTWLRRVYLDLIGMSPTPEAVDAFLADTSVGARSRQVDSILNTDAYAERMASIWLDNARYADSNGFQYDLARTMWPWRDWVIKSFRQNMPYDQFTTEQLAGDLLPEPSYDQIIATGFNRNHGYTIEGGVIDEEYRVQYVKDRVTTFGTVFLGLTLDCTSCHDHKYDPLTQKDYYQLYSFFNNIPERGKYGLGAPDSNIRHYAPEVRGKLKMLQSGVEALKKESNKKLSGEELESFLNWKAFSVKNYLTPDASRVSTQEGSTVKELEDKSWLFSGTLPDYDVYTYDYDRIGKSKFRTFIIEALSDPFLPKLGPGRRENGNAVLTGVELTATSLVDETKVQKVTWAKAKADFSQKKLPIQNVINPDKKGWGMSPRHDSRLAVLEATTDFGFDHDYRIEVKLRFQSPYAKHMFGRVRLSFGTGLIDDTYTSALIDRMPEDEKQKYFKKNIWHQGGLGKELLTAEKDLKTLQDSSQVYVMVMKEAARRKAYILERGAYDKYGREVFEDTPASLPDLDKDLPRNRLGLAQWLTHENHPLMSRVTVNRFWQMLFGRGLVKTTEDFGAQGELPTHPQLLDWLAVDFIENKWDVHHLLKKIVLSSTYRQISKIRQDPEDPENKLLARGSRFRLEAEIIRDQALAVSGLLAPAVGGPSVYPYLPGNLWGELTNRALPLRLDYTPSHGGALYRKSMYTFVRRAQPNPGMETFDAPSRDVCVVKRSRTNTPLQALNLLHAPIYTEASRALAEDIILICAAKSLTEKIRYAFRRVVVRSPGDDELFLLLKLYQSELLLLESKPELIESKLAIGESKSSETIDRKELAAMTTICLTLFNLSETITRN
ncbi:MAG TPA: DUF1553 domain-containing protein [Verrucomicrobiales bacterium]|nr:DUF1553 domain-containing protein [Verrucomicrobiales bacterium]